MHERWKIIPLFHDYEVSDLGNLRTAEGKEPLTPTVEDGLRRIVLRGDDGRRHNCNVGGLVLAAFRGPGLAPKDRPVYVSGQPDDCLSNLRYGTRAEQLARFSHLGGAREGSGRPRKLSAPLVERVMRSIDAKKTTLRAAARKLNISRSTLSDAIHRLRQPG